MSVIPLPRDRRVKFSIERAFFVSLALHAAIATPIGIELSRVATEEEDPFIVDLSGGDDDSQANEIVKRQIAGAGAQAADSREKMRGQEGVKPDPEQTADEATAQAAAPTQKETKRSSASDATGSVNMEGAERQQVARRLRRRQAEVDPLQFYAATVSKRVRSKLVYPEAGLRAGLHGAALVSFTIRADGSLRDDALKIVTSSGQQKLDDSALQTIRACAPFSPPPREITLKIDVDFYRK